MTERSPNDIARIYRRLGRALHCRSGVRLSPTDVETLVCGRDLLEGAVLDACGRLGIEDLVQLGPQEPARIDDALEEAIRRVGGGAMKVDPDVTEILEEDGLFVTRLSGPSSEDRYHIHTDRGDVILALGPASRVAEAILEDQDLYVDLVRVTMGERTEEERGLILRGLGMIRGVLAVDDDPTDPSTVWVHVRRFSTDVGAAMIAFEGVKRTTLVRRELWEPF